MLQILDALLGLAKRVDVRLCGLLGMNPRFAFGRMQDAEPPVFKFLEEVTSAASNAQPVAKYERIFVQIRTSNF